MIGKNSADPVRLWRSHVRPIAAPDAEGINGAWNPAIKGAVLGAEENEVRLYAIGHADPPASVVQIRDGGNHSLNASRAA